MTKTASNLFLTSIFRIARAFFGGVLLFSLLSCMKDPELKPDFGPEVTGDDYSKAIQKLSLPDPYTIKKGEFAYFTTETFLEGRPYALDKRWAYTVTDKVDDTASNQWIFTYVREMREYVGGQEKVSNDTSTARLTKKASALDPQSIETKSLAQAVDFKMMTMARDGISISEVEPQKSLTTIQAQAAQKRQTFHNLRVDAGFFPTPDFVQKRTDCGRKDPAKCKDPLRVNVLSYDMVNWDDMQKYHVEWVITAEAPYFGSTRLNLADANDSFPGVLRSCTSTTLQIQGQSVRVTQCDELKDFTFGHD